MQLGKSVLSPEIPGNISRNSLNAFHSIFFLPQVKVLILLSMESVFGEESPALSIMKVNS